jgi:hypothetical protein
MRKYQLSKTDDRVNLAADRILCNDVVLPGDTNPHRVGLWLIEGVYGPIAAVWASNEQDALDEAVDSELMEGYRLSDEDAADRTKGSGDDAEEDFARLGNAGEPFDLNDVGMHKLAWKDLPQDLQGAFVAAAEEGFSDVDEYDEWLEAGGNDDDDDEDDDDDDED